MKNKHMMKQTHEKAKESMLISAGLYYRTSSETQGRQQNISLRPYKDKTLATRVLREIWFRLRLPEHVWYNKEILKHSPKTISVYDCLVTKRFLQWLLINNPNSKITFDYCNLVGRAKHIFPDQIPRGISATTYDRADSERYGMILRSGGEFPREHLRERKPIEYDVFYVGADKGRGDYLLELKESFEKMGLRVKMIITADGKLSKRKRYYSKPISYNQVLDYDSKSKAILNIILPGQVGATQRDYEALFLRTKLITNNKNARYFDFYRRENIFILGEDDITELPRFIDAPLAEVPDCVLDRHLSR